MPSPTTRWWRKRRRFAGIIAVTCMVSCSDDPASDPDPNNTTATNGQVDPFAGLSERDPGEPKGPGELEPDNGPIGPDDPFCTEDCSAMDDQCVVGVCGAEGECVTEARADGTACDDDDLCTIGDVCAEGECRSAVVECAASNACTTAACDPETGDCVETNASNGTPCETDDICIIAECLDGGCIGGVELDCSATPTDQCSYAFCDRQLGCTSAPSPNIGCDDGDLCTVGDRCDDQGGCVGTPIDCAAQAGPRQTATCDSATGACVFTDAQDGAVCDDGNACTENDSCLAGVCSGLQTQCKAGSDAVVTH